MSKSTHEFEIEVKKWLKMYIFMPVGAKTLLLKVNNFLYCAQLNNFIINILWAHCFKLSWTSHVDWHWSKSLCGGGGGGV